MTLLLMLAVIAIGMGIISRGRRARREPAFGYVYVNQDGTAREVSPGEREYLSAEFSGGDGGRPYIKSAYESRDGWGSLSGFIERRQVPPHVRVAPVHPGYDAAVRRIPFDPLAIHRAAGDRIETRADGSVSCTPNPDVPVKERFELSRRAQLAEQLEREKLARIDVRG